MISDDLVPVNAYQFGWKPKWNSEKFLNSMDNEIQAVLDWDKGLTNIFDVFASKDEQTQKSPEGQCKVWGIWWF